MIQSMTGFGKAVAELPSKKVTIEIKSLNSKQMDLSTRIPGVYREKEMLVRSMIAQELERGKIDFSIFVESIGKESGTSMNVSVIESYMNQINALSKNLHIPVPANWFEILLRLPDVMKSDIQELDEEEWDIVFEAIKQALKQFTAFRVQEGKMLEALFTEKIASIKRMLGELELYEAERIEKVRARIEEALENTISKDYDKNRLEQEMIYYIEKLDVNEEKNRLANHLKYFLETMDHAKGQGKKLGFIAQEMGREINTLGSKSNHSEMQKIVVRMKDELEQMKEQVLNVL